MLKHSSINYTVEIGVFCPLKCTRKEAKNPVFDNKLHNEVVTYSKSTTMRHIYILRILSIESTILDK